MFLKGFNGILLVDGFSGYNKVECECLANCWVHARRYFIQAAICSADTAVYDQAMDMVFLMDKIFWIESEMKERKLNKKGRREERQKRTLPVVDQIFEGLKKIDVDSLSSEKMKKACNYLKNHEEGLRVFLDDPLVPPHNNKTEANFVPFSRGRNNWLFAYSEEGAEMLATMYSMIQTAKANHLNPARYLEYVMEKLMPWVINDQVAAPESVLESLMPWSPEVQRVCLSKNWEGYEELIAALDPELEELHSELKEGACETAPAASETPADAEPNSQNHLNELKSMILSSGFLDQSFTVSS